ncbi:MAG: SUMF1/EgtB/PvdO family nonheme iron enzyme [Planctomycetes bacterium]|nr:SUMF1/EgtB/PvdO family nonheme iron enzyme [Planctomycetota bacterium]
MRSVIVGAAALAVCVCGAGIVPGAGVARAAVTFTWADIGNAGNAADPSTGYGAVLYDYRIATTEVTNAQYAEFLNAVAASDPHGLYNSNMGSDARGGITRTGADGSYTYATKTNMADKPVNYVSWLDSARFVNWLSNGQGSAPTESGVYTINNGLTESRAGGASYFLPSEDEWYKAAYYDPNTSSYFLYATGSNSVPTLATANAIGDISNPGANVVNFNSGAVWNSQNGNVTTVGSAGAAGASPYGTFDQNGNVLEWNEALISASFRGARGGSWSVNELRLRSSTRGNGIPTDETSNIGFRVASSALAVPEPTSAMLMLLGSAATLYRRRH